MKGQGRYRDVLSLVYGRYLIQWNLKENLPTNEVIISAWKKKKLKYSWKF